MKEQGVLPALAKPTPNTDGIRGRIKERREREQQLVTNVKQRRRETTAAAAVGCSRAMYWVILKSQVSQRMTLLFKGRQGRLVSNLKIANSKS